MYTYMKAYRDLYFHITFKFQKTKNVQTYYYKIHHQKTIAQILLHLVLCKISFLCQKMKERLQSITGDFLVHTKIFGIHGEIKPKHTQGVGGY